MKKTLYDDKNFEDMYQKYSHLIYKIAYQYTLNISYSEDIMHDVFVKLLLNKKMFLNETHEKAWIIRVTINQCKNIIKSKDFNSYSLFDNEKSLELIESNVDSKIDIENAIKSLSKDERICILLYYYENYTTKEISNILKMNENTVKSHIKRAKSKLKNLLER